MDFVTIRKRIDKGVPVIYPDYKVFRSSDLMIRGRSFYAIWDPGLGLWSTDEYRVQILVDQLLRDYVKTNFPNEDYQPTIKLLSNFTTGSWGLFKQYISNLADNAVPLDTKLTFSNTVVTKADHVSKRLPYPLEPGNLDAYEELISTLYDPEQRAKLEWGIGSIISGDSVKIQKFIVLYGEPGGGKSTILNVIERLFQGYVATFDAKALTSNSNTFSTEAFKHNPIVAIQHDGDLSGIADNTKLNALVSHEPMTINEKHKPTYTATSHAFLFMGTNKPVRITDAKSGIIRRMIDVRTSGRKVPTKRYNDLMSQIDFELGAIAHHCLNVYSNMGPNYYSGYRAVEMMLQTDVMLNYVENHFYTFKTDDGISLSRAYDLYKAYCEEALIEHKLPRHKFRDELKSYFSTFNEVARVNGSQVRSYYSGFRTDRFNSIVDTTDDAPASWISLSEQASQLDIHFKDAKAQYARGENPTSKWANVKTTVSDLNTSLLHYVVPGPQDIVVDFDLRDESGQKSLQLNIDAASKFPPTYVETSKSGKGLHLHYIYDGDPLTLSRLYQPGIDILVPVVGPVGPTAIRRQLSLCNNLPVAHINTGLPKRTEKKMLDEYLVKSEKALRDLLERNMRKEIHASTKSSIDFIYKILEDAYKSGLRYDLNQMRPDVLGFALDSTNHSDYCVDLVAKMHFSSDSLADEDSPKIPASTDTPIVFYDVEVFPNLVLICWQYDADDAQIVRMINPTPAEVEGLFQYRLIGYNNRRYDNHILYAVYMGFSNEEVYEVSSRIIGNSPNAMFRQAYNISYTDVYDFSSEKKSLKRWELELGLRHHELGLPWDKPVPENMWHKVADYCDDDVRATRSVFYHLKDDFKARLILAELSGLTPNDTTQAHTSKIIFGEDQRPQDKFEYVDLSTYFRGYKFEKGVSTYRGYEVGEGGFVYAEPGIYTNVALLDVASMHPSSILAMNSFGKYTARYKELLDARLAIKHKNYEKAKQLLGGILTKYLDTEESANALAYALKIHALNIVYGLTAAAFDNKFKDPRNRDNVVAKRGALFMVDLKHAIESQGFSVVHIKTDSVKIPNATPEIIKFVSDFGVRYGYTFEHEATYEKFCLVNNAVYIALTNSGPGTAKWKAVGAEFAHPFVYKTLFSKEPITDTDYQEIKNVKSTMYLDFNENLPDVSLYEKELSDRLLQKLKAKKKSKIDLSELSNEDLAEEISKGHSYSFVGGISSFVPVRPNFGGGILLRYDNDKYTSVTGTKGYRWVEYSTVKDRDDFYDIIDMEYYRGLVDAAKAHIDKFGNFFE